MFRVSNPTLRNDTFNRYAYLTGANPASLMTVEGTINKALILFAILVFSGIGGAWLVLSNPAIATPLILGGAIVGFVLAIVISFKAELAPALSPIYAAVKGVAVGGISLVFESLYHGIVFNAAVLTVSILGVMLLLYRLGVLRATPTFVRVITFAIFGIMITYVVDLVMMMFGMRIGFIHEGTPIGIIFSLFVCGIAALTFIIDFDFIQKGAQSGAPKFMEWYAGFSLLVTLVWLYLEILRLLAKLQRR